jgi:hypothetical protein
MGVEFKHCVKTAITKIASLKDSDIATVDGITTVTIDGESKVVSVGHLEDLSALHTGYVCNTGENEDYWYISDDYFKANYKQKLDMTPVTELRKSFGIMAVNLNFNPSKLGAVDKAKIYSAHLIDLVEDKVKADTTDSSVRPTWIYNVFRTAAFNAVIAAQMAVVKFLTWIDNE